MYYSSGNYEAFAHPKKPEGVDNKSAYIIGSGLAALTAACYLVRDGQMQPEVTSVSIPSKSLSSEPLVISTTAEFFVFLILFLIPVAMFVGGIVVFVRRRKL